MLYHQPSIAEGRKLRCPRCGAVLLQHRHDCVERCLMLVLAALILFTVANAYPLLSLDLQGREQDTLLITGVIELYRQNQAGLAVLVLCVSILLPLIKLLSQLYVLLPLYFGWRGWRLPVAMRIVDILHPWAMMEVYMLGILVAIVKLASLASIVPDAALYAFAALIMVMAATDASLEPHDIWERLSKTR
ncbi:MAG: paraquat-inducible protein A [Gammaproteobacteria bacterium]|nr:paraquat-inducible protein A [Gammaproteobacteria bacterium]